MSVLSKKPVPGPTGLMFIGSIAVDDDGFVWQLWSFDPHDQAEMFWIRHTPGRWLMGGPPMPVHSETRPARRIPGRVLWCGRPEGY